MRVIFYNDDDDFVMEFCSNRNARVLFFVDWWNRFAKAFFIRDGNFHYTTIQYTEKWEKIQDMIHAQRKSYELINLKKIRGEEHFRFGL